MNKKQKYEQGERIYFEMGDDKSPKGFGIVCGQVGPVIIIQLEIPIDKYNYTHTYVMDNQIKESPKSE